MVVRVNGSVTSPTTISVPLELKGDGRIYERVALALCFELLPRAVGLPKELLQACHLDRTAYLPSELLILSDNN
ncbi:MAG: hypothetical protein QW407_02515 [Thermofilaceae archaeon]